MSHIPPSLSACPEAPPKPSSSSASPGATYQTNLNPPEHSKSTQPRLTLEMLSILRVPLMVRSAFIFFLLVTFLSASAAAARINTVRLPEHASVKKGSVHRPHSSHLAPHSARATSRSGRSARSSASHRASSRATRHAQSRRTSARRAAYSAPHRSSGLHSRYGGSNSHARHSAPSSAVHTETREPQAEPSNTESEPSQSEPSRTPNPPASEPAAGAVSDQNPLPASAAAVTTASAEPDTAPAGSEPSTMEAVGNSLAAAPAAARPIAPPDDQVAELRAPQIFSSRVDRYTLRGTHDSLVRQNARAEQDALERIEDDADLHDRIARGLLVRVPESSALAVNPALPDERRYCRPWTADFLSDLARAHHAQFRGPIIVSSAVRTVEYQKHLMRINRNAADAEGDVVSPHVTGATIDIAKSGLSRKEMLWMRNQLLSYQNAGVIDVEEEFHQRCFHITVYKNYVSASSSSHQQRETSAMPAQSSTDAPSPAGLNHE
ncbi:MAG TPA: DUF5715 family protein [Terracidiphilus sp.]|nr:DUF5715 family protein [Terracidiphilus sp.]